MLRDLLLAGLLLTVVARYASTDMNIAQFKRLGGWVFVDRMVLAEGKSSVKFDVALIVNQLASDNVYPLQALVIADGDWKVEVEQKCGRIIQNGLMHQLTLHRQNGYRSTVSVDFTIEKEQTYHFIVRDCQKRLVNDNFASSCRLEVKADINNNGSVQSVTERCHMYLLPLLLIAMYYMHRVISKQHNDPTKQENGYVVTLLRVGLSLSAIGIAFKLFGYLIYIYISGKEYGVFQIFYLLCHSLADSIMCTFLILLSFGWMVTFKFTADFDLYLPLIGMLGLINIIMSLLGKITDGQHDKFHVYDTIPSYILVAFKFISLLIFCIGVVKSTCFEESEERKQQSRGYFLKIGVIGLLYFCAIPWSMYGVRYVETGYRREIVFYMVELVKNAMNAVLIGMISSPKSSYSRLSDCSFMQKGDKYY